MLRIVLSPIIVVLYYLNFPGWNFWAGGLFIVAAFTDTFDGLIARKYNIVTTFGKLIDPMADKILLLCASLVLMATGQIPMWVVVIMLAREFVVSGYRLLAASKGVIMAAEASGKWKTIVQFTGIGFLFFKNPVFADYGVPFGEILVYAGLALSVVSCIIYICHNRNVMDG